MAVARAIGRGASGIADLAIAVAVLAAIVLADAHRRHNALAVTDIDDAYASGGATRNANSIHRASDQRAAVGHQHDLVVVEHRKGRDDRSTPTLADFGETHQLHALAAAS